MSRMISIVVVSMVLAACVSEVGEQGGGGGDGKGDGLGGGGGGGDGDGGGTGGTLGVTEFLTAMGHKDCDDAFTCKANFPADAGVTFEEAFGADQQACYALVAEYYDAAAVEAAITAGKIAFDGAAAKTCVDGMAAATCTTYWDEGPNVPDACWTVLVGNVAVGGACTTDFECSGENWCDESNKCAPIPAGE